MSQAGSFSTGSSGGSSVLFLEVNDGTKVGPDGSGTISIPGNHGITTRNTAASTAQIQLDNTISLGDLSPVGAGSNALTVTTGDVSLVAGNLKLPTTSSSNVGVIEVNAARFIHSFGTNNTFVGSSSGNFTLTGNQNSAFGSNSLASLATGSGNIVLGFNSGSAYVGAESNNILIGNNGTLGDTGVIRIGTNATQTGCFIAGIDGVSVGATAKVVTEGSDQLGTATITAGSNISVTPGINTITIAATGVVTSVSAGNNITITGTAAAPIVNVSGTTNHSLLLGNATGSINSLGVATNGQIPIGSTGVDPVLATITAGTNISVTNGAGSITIATTGPASFTWQVITVNQTAVVNNGYICNKAGTLALLLPATAIIGDIIRVTGINTALGWQITQNANQQIFFGTGSTTVGVGGSLASTATRDTVEMVCVVAGASTVWNVISSIGNITVT